MIRLGFSLLVYTTTVTIPNHSVRAQRKFHQCFYFGGSITFYLRMLLIL